MSQRVRSLVAIAAAALVLSVGSTPLAAQGKGKHYAVSSDKAVTVTREVLVRQGYEVVRIETDGPSQIVYYRAGNKGKGKGKSEGGAEKPEKPKKKAKAGGNNTVVVGAIIGVVAVAVLGGGYFLFMGDDSSSSSSSSSSGTPGTGSGTPASMPA